MIDEGGACAYFAVSANEETTPAGVDLVARERVDFNLLLSFKQFLVGFFFVFFVAYSMIEFGEVR